MLPNIATQSAVLKKCLSAQFGIDLKTHQATEIIARMMGFSDYQNLLRGVETVGNRIFEGRVLHAVASAHYFSGEDEVCYFLGQILNLQKKNYFVVEARGYWSASLSQKPSPMFEVFKPNEFYDAIQIPHKDRDRGRDSYWSHPANYLIAASAIFPEVMVFEHDDAESSKRIICDYIETKPFETGIISAGERNGWHCLNEVSSHANYLPVCHLAISKNYATGSDTANTKKRVESIRKEMPNVSIVAWIFEDDCATSDDDRYGRDREIYQEKKTGWPEMTEIEGLGFVKQGYTRNFFLEILEILKQHGIPFIRVPHYKGHKCFIDKDITPRQVAERDRVTQDILTQMQALGLKK